MIPEGWNTYRINEIAELRKEQFLPNDDELYYIGLEHIEQQNLRLNGIGSSKDVISNKFKFYPGDILYGKLRPYFRKVYQPKFKGVCSTDIYVIKSKGIIDKSFLFYLVASENFTNIANSGSTGTKMPRADWSQIAKSEWIIPENPKEQKLISSILSSLDDKIELNLQMNKNLESIAQAIFKEWFVDFRFPGFDGELVDGLPKGWRKGRLGEDFKLIMGQSPPGESYNEIEEGTIFYQGRTDFGFRFPENRMYTTAPSRMAKRLDTLVSVRAPVGDINMALEDCCIGRGLSAVRHRSGGYSYTYYAMKSVENIFKGFEGEGTVFGSINKPNFENINMVIPKEKVIEQFENLVNPIDEKILINSLEIKTLTAIRDTLLPKLMTGKIRVT